MNKKLIIPLVLLVGLTLYSNLTSSCEDDAETADKPDTENNVNANVVTSDPAVSRLEMPKIDSRYDFICYKLSDGDVNFSLLYNKNLFHAVWAAYTYDSKNAQRNFKTRSDTWSVEHFYDNDKEYQLRTSTFPNGFNRGHIVGSAERYYSQEANEQTFVMSNVSPQNGRFNASYWGEIEDKARDNWGRKIVEPTSRYYGGTLYIAKGGTTDQLLTTINVKNTLGNPVSMIVPRYYWMACLFVYPNGEKQAIGFWLEHKDYQNTTKAFLAKMRQEAACSIDELERRTGLDFFCNLPDNVEKKVEATFDISLWDGI